MRHLWLDNEIGVRSASFPSSCRQTAIGPSRWTVATTVMEAGRRAHPWRARMVFGYGRGYGQVGHSWQPLATVGHPKGEAPGGLTSRGFSYYLAATLLQGPAS